MLFWCRGRFMSHLLCSSSVCDGCPPFFSRLVAVFLREMSCSSGSFCSCLFDLRFSWV